jgi:hypothetical protein
MQVSQQISFQKGSAAEQNEPLGELRFEWIVHVSLLSVRYKRAWVTMAVSGMVRTKKNTTSQQLTIVFVPFPCCLFFSFLQAAPIALIICQETIHARKIVGLEA